MPRTPHIERHFTASDSVRDVVIGMSDGLTVPFALAAGLSGAVGSSGVVVVAGLAEIAAGAIAMGLGGYLAPRGDAAHYTIERARGLAETAAKPAAEAAEVTHILRSFGLTTEDTEPIVAALRFRHGAAEPLVLRGVLQEVDALDELVLGVVDARDVVEGDLRPRVAAALGTAAAESEEPPTAGHHAPIHPDEPHDQEERGAEAEDQVLPEGPALVEQPRVDHHALLLEQRLETGIGEGGQQRLEAQRGARVRPLARVGHLLLEGPLDRVALAGHLLDVARLHLLLEERVGNVDVARLGGERPHDDPVGRHDDEDGEPPRLRPEAALALGALGRRAARRACHRPIVAQRTREKLRGVQPLSRAKPAGRHPASWQAVHVGNTLGGPSVWPTSPHVSRRMASSRGWAWPTSVGIDVPQCTHRVRRLRLPSARRALPLIAIDVPLSLFLLHQGLRPVTQRQDRGHYQNSASPRRNLPRTIQCW